MSDYEVIIVETDICAAFCHTEGTAVDVIHEEPLRAPVGLLAPSQSTPQSAQLQLIVLELIVLIRAQRS